MNPAPEMEALTVKSLTLLHTVNKANLDFRDKCVREHGLNHFRHVDMMINRNMVEKGVSLS